MAYFMGLHVATKTETPWGPLSPEFHFKRPRGAHLYRPVLAACRLPRVSSLGVEVDQWLGTTIEGVKQSRKPELGAKCVEAYTQSTVPRRTSQDILNSIR